MLTYKAFLVSIFCLFLIGNSAGEDDFDERSYLENTENPNWPERDVRPFSFEFERTTQENQYLNNDISDYQKSEYEALTVKVLKRLGVPFPDDNENDDRRLTIRDLKLLGLKLPQFIGALNESLTIDDFKKLGIPWQHKTAGPDSQFATEELKNLEFDWMKDLLLSKQRKLILSDLKKLGYPLPPDVNPLHTLTMEDLEALSKKRPLPKALYGIRTLADVRQAIEKVERPLIDLLSTIGLIDSLDPSLTGGRRANDLIKSPFTITEPNCKNKKEFKRDCIGNVSSYCQYDMSRYMLPTPWKIKNWCCGINEKINCAVKWLTSCDSPIETSDYTRGKAYIMSQFCNNSIKIQRYSELGPCHDRVKAEWNFCYREFESHLITLYDMINNNELNPKDSIDFCCIRARFRGCVMQLLNSEKKMIDTNNSYCSSENFEALKEFTLVFSNGLSYKSCNDFQLSKCQFLDGPFSFTMERLEYNAGRAMSHNVEITLLILWSGSNYLFGM